MRRHLLIPGVLIAILLAPDVAHAQHLTKTALSGKPLKLNFSNATNPDCSSVGETVVRLTQAPQHGKITISKASEFPSFPKGNARRDCNKQRVPGTQTVYVPEAGYTGTDTAAIEIIFPTGATARRSYTITVK
jgi:hypothetical protein